MLISMTIWNADFLWNYFLTNETLGQLPIYFIKIRFSCNQNIGETLTQCKKVLFDFALRERLFKQNWYKHCSPAFSLMQKLCCHNFTTVIILIDITNPIDKLILETFRSIIKAWHTTNHLKVSSKNLQLFQPIRKLDSESDSVIGRLATNLRRKF